MKEYLGDSVYAEWDGSELTLTTNNGYDDDPRNIIIFEDITLVNLLKFLEHIKSLQHIQDIIYIPNWQTKALVCADCNTQKSVKYRRRSDDRPICNLCAMKGII